MDTDVSQVQSIENADGVANNDECWKYRKCPTTWPDDARQRVRELEGIALVLARERDTSNQLRDQAHALAQRATQENDTAMQEIAKLRTRLSEVMKMQISSLNEISSLRESNLVLQNKCLRLTKDCANASKKANSARAVRQRTLNSAPKPVAESPAITKHATYFDRLSAQSYCVREAGDCLSATCAPRNRVALCRSKAPMFGKNKYYAEFELASIGDGAVVGIARPWLDVEQRNGWDGCPNIWGVATHCGRIRHGGQLSRRWEGIQHFTSGDTIGLLLDCGSGLLTVYKNGMKLGVAVTGLQGEFCWAVALESQGHHVRVTETGQPPV